jgi:hypothetical protein
MPPLIIAVSAFAPKSRSAMSSGSKPIKMEPRGKESRGMRYTEWQWLELSCVTIGAKSDATITAIRSADTAQRRIHVPPAHIVRLDGTSVRREDVVRLTPADWQHVRR